MKIEKSNQNIICLLLLWHIFKADCRAMQMVRKNFVNWQEIFTAKKNSLEKIGIEDAVIKAIKNPPWKLVERDIAWEDENESHHILTLENNNYPSILREISFPPHVIFCDGDISFLDLHKLAMVGSRNPSHAGLENAHAFAFTLAKMGFVIVSGLACGIDAACHRGALDANGKTIAVMGTGVDNIYPVCNKDLALKIKEKGGILLSEFPLCAKPSKYNFPRRNRIISGLSLGTIVLEAALKSGSLITARHASEQGREVFALPGSIHNPLARGCHSILRQGAKLVESVEDILEELQLVIPELKKIKEDGKKDTKKSWQSMNLDAKSKILLQCFDDDVVSFDDLVARSGLKACDVASLLTMLEMEKIVKAVPGGYII